MSTEFVIFLSVASLIVSLAYSAYGLFKKKVQLKSLGWIAVSWLLFGFCAFCFSTGIYRGTVTGGLEFCALQIVVLAFLSARDILLPRIHEVLSRHSPRLQLSARLIKDALILCLFYYLCLFCLEYPFNGDLLAINSDMLNMERAWILFCILSAYFLFQQRLFGPYLLLIAASFFGIAQREIFILRGSVLTPGDFLVIGTAAEVSDKVSLQLEERMLVIFGILALATLLCAYSPKRLSIPKLSQIQDFIRSIKANCSSRNFKAFKKPFALILNLALCLSFYAAQQGMLDQIEAWMKPNFKFWNPQDSYEEQGTWGSFYHQIRNMAIAVPEGYSPEAATALQRELAAAFDASPEGAAYAKAAAQFEKNKPTVIAIMNESYANLNIYKEVAEALPDEKRYPTNIGDALMSGQSFVSVSGGGTANSEFEFLTESAMNFVGIGKISYAQYNLSKTASLPRFFDALGYDTLAMHPEHPSNYRRISVYQELGFQEARFKDTFEAMPGASIFHAGYSDETTYNMILQRLEEDKNPQFIFDLTMQNHSAYDKNNIDAALLPNVYLKNHDYDFNRQLAEYLACLHESDRALEQFLGQLKELDRPVVVIFFGDHEPVLYKQLLEQAGEMDDVTKNAMQYQTVYTMWANYDVDGAKQENQTQPTSLNYLAARALAKMGAPLTDFQKAQLELAKTMPSVILAQYQDSEGVWHKSNDEVTSPAQEAAKQSYDKLAILQYLNFATTVQ